MTEPYNGCAAPSGLEYRRGKTKQRFRFTPAYRCVAPSGLVSSDVFLERASEAASEASETAREAASEGTVEGRLALGVLALSCLLGSLAGKGYTVSVRRTMYPHGVMALRDAVKARADAGAGAVVGDDVGMRAYEAAALDAEILSKVGFVAPAAVAAELPQLSQLIEDLVVVAAEDDVAWLAEFVVYDGVVRGLHLDGCAGKEAFVDAGQVAGLGIQLHP